jgi:hypothetical protein
MTHPLRTGVADQIALFRAYDTDGTAKVDLTSATTGLSLTVFRTGLAQVSISSLTDKAADDTTHADGAIRRIGGNLYSVDLPDAAMATYCPSISVRGTYTGGEIEPIVHPMAGYNPSLVAVGANTVEPTNLSAAQVRTELATELGRIDVAISSRSTFAGGAVASVTAPVTVGTNNDKTGYALTTPPLDSNQTQAAAAAAITAAGLPEATSAKIAADVDSGANDWDGAINTIASQTTTSVWSFTIAVVDTVQISAATVLSGVLTLLARVTGLQRTKAEDDAADGVLAGLIGEIEGGGGGGGGGGDATEDKQDQIIALIAGQQVIQVPSPNVDGNLVLTQGDTYDGIGNPKAQWNVTTDYTDGWGVSLTIRDEDDNVIYFAAGVVASATLITVVIDTPTGLPMQGCPGVWKGKFDVELAKNQSVKTIALGSCYIQEDQTR